MNKTLFKNVLVVMAGVIAVDLVRKNFPKSRTIIG